MNRDPGIIWSTIFTRILILYYHNHAMDKNAAIIEPRKGKREDPLPPLAVLIFTPLDLDQFIRSFPLPPQRTHRIYLADVYTGTYGSTAVSLVGPMLGAPQTILVLEKLIALGVKSVMAVGWCGSLQPHVRIGDVILASGGISEEGTSSHYPIDSSHPGPSPELLNGLKGLLRSRCITVHDGPVWSTDAPFRETIGKVITYREQGVLAVDMETTALFTVACYRGIRLAAALVVSDELCTMKWVHGFRDSKFRETREQLVHLTLNALCTTSKALPVEEKQA